MNSNNEYKAYAERILAAHGLSPECKQAEKGLFHYVFISDNAVVRIPREHKAHNFHGEKWAMEHSRENGVPVPRIISVDDTKSVVPVPYMLEERLFGETMWSGQNVKPSPQLCREMGYLLARIHEIPTAGYGQLDGNGHGKFPTWAERLNHRRANELQELMNINAPLGERANVAFDELVQVKFSPCLLHGDYFLGNLLIKGDKVTGVIDFNAFSGTPYFEIGNLAFRYAPELLKEIETGYGKPFDERLALLNAVDNIVGKIPSMVNLMPLRAELLQEKLDETLKKLEK